MSTLVERLTGRSTDVVVLHDPRGVKEFNPYHDHLGRFTSAPFAAPDKGGGSGGGASPKPPPKPRHAVRRKGVINPWIEAGKIEGIKPFNPGPSTSELYRGTIKGNDVVIKPVAGEPGYYLRDGIDDLGAQREVAAAVVNAEMGYLVDVPASALRNTPVGYGFVQEFVPNANTVGGYHGWDRVDAGEVKDLAVFDVLVGNLDRHGGNALLDQTNHLVAIDHSLSFPDTNDTWMWANAYSLETANYNTSQKSTTLDLDARHLNALRRLSRRWDTVEAKLVPILGYAPVQAMQKRLAALLTKRALPMDNVHNHSYNDWIKAVS